jgi:hypothetical protein
VKPISAGDKLLQPISAGRRSTGFCKPVVKPISAGDKLLQPISAGRRSTGFCNPFLPLSFFQFLFRIFLFLCFIFLSFLPLPLTSEINWLCSSTYLWIDLAAGPVDFGPALSGDGVLPRGEFRACCPPRPPQIAEGAAEVRDLALTLKKEEIRIKKYIKK